MEANNGQLNVYESIYRPFTSYQVLEDLYMSAM
jgi:hypothetical protein